MARLPVYLLEGLKHGLGLPETWPPGIPTPGIPAQHTQCEGDTSLHPVGAHGTMRTMGRSSALTFKEGQQKDRGPDSQGTHLMLYFTH